MHAPNMHQTIFWMTLFGIIQILFCLSSCSQPRRSFVDYSTYTLDNDNGTLCVDVPGHVLGAVLTNATVYLYRAQTLDFDFVMKMVRFHHPWKTSRINESKEFPFSCLAEGLYILAIPSDSFFNRSVGSTLPYESETENYSINIVYQGGDGDFLVGAFSINRTDQTQS